MTIFIKIIKLSISCNFIKMNYKFQTSSLIYNLKNVKDGN